jgi:hypothetical protein
VKLNQCSQVISYANIIYNISCTNESEITWSGTCAEFDEVASFLISAKE